jgi:hypothetical protein
VTRLTLPIKLFLLIAIIAALAVPAVASATPLSVKEARGQIKTATLTWAQLVDGHARIGSCQRMQSHVVRCSVVISSARTRCEMRVSVSRGSKWDAVRARGVHCRDS